MNFRGILDRGGVKKYNRIVTRIAKIQSLKVKIPNSTKQE